eukprot:GHVP01022765.1.p1 GENE.GHVP01022765.1~~GHVP01022765.1.p1  ORF type:complete len:552 (+),score=63.56 GHVP01022765.1:11-1666(+)
MILNDGLLETQKQTLDRILNCTSGIKALFLDISTRDILGTLVAMEYLTDHEIYLVRDISHLKTQTEDLRFSSCIILIHPSIENLDYIIKELSTPQFSEYFIYFTKNITQEIIEELAIHDIFEKITLIEVCWMDYIVTSKNSFIVSEDRCIDSLYSLIASMKINPSILYTKESSKAFQTSTEIGSRMDSGNRENDSMLIIVDRASDLLAPILIDWSYFSLVGLLNERILNSRDGKYKESSHTGRESCHAGRLSNPTNTPKDKPSNPTNAPKDKPSAPAEQYKMPLLSDEFYLDTMHLPFCDIGNKIQEFLKKKTSTKPYQTEHLFEKFKGILDEKSISDIIKKHLWVCNSINSFIEDEGLFYVSEAEQDIVNGIISTPERLYRKIKELDVSESYKINLCVIYGLRYKHRTTFSIGLLEDIMNRLELSKDSINILNEVLKKDKGDWIKKKRFYDIPNIISSSVYYDQGYRSRLLHVIESILEGSCESYGLELLKGNMINSKKYIFFFIGGASYNEMELLHSFSNDRKIDIIVGGTKVATKDVVYDDVSSNKVY